MLQLSGQFVVIYYFVIYFFAYLQYLKHPQFSKNVLIFQFCAMLHEAQLHLSILKHEVFQYLTIL